MLDNETENIGGMLPLVPGMPMVVRDNLATEIGICNGATCTLRRVVLHENEEHLPKGPGETNFLHYQPKMLIVHMDTKPGEEPIFDQFPGLSKGEFPIFPQTKTFTHATLGSIKRTGFPVLPAFAITGYCAQGKTYSRAIIDLAKPTGRGAGPVNPADYYVLLSRLRTLEGVVILRPFDKANLLRQPNADLDKFFETLRELALKTAERSNI
jgi:hypothetical protein